MNEGRNTNAKYLRMLELIQDLAAYHAPDDHPELRSLVERAKVLSQPKGLNNVDIASARDKAVLANKAKGKITIDRVMPLIDQMLKDGVTEYKAIAMKLNSDGVPSPKSGSWHAATVRRIMLSK